ncbi:hypothetical protein S40293_02961 [Stachybotrys chartarum IBT 40293]|nr:hypothetical protein S40293_02961 [Stachybotrys chartarum IBT 40293]
MDLTSLLNASTAVKSSYSAASREGSPQPDSRETESQRSSDSPSPRSAPRPVRPDNDAKSNKSRTPWNADGYALPFHIQAKDSRSPSLPIRASSEHLDTASSSGQESEATEHSRATSTDSSVDIVHSRAPTPMSNTQVGRPALSDADSQRQTPRQGPRREAMGPGIGEPGAPRHKLSDSHSSLSSFASSSFSASHSRMSSATTISGVNSVNSLQMELPLLDSKLVQLPEAVEVPTMGSVQPPSPAYPMAEQYAPSLAMTRRQSSTPGFLEHSSNAGLNRVNVSNRHLTSTTDFSSQARTGPSGFSSRFHKRAISAPNCAPSTYSRSSSFSQVYPILPPPHLMANQSQEDLEFERSARQSSGMAKLHVQHAIRNQRETSIHLDEERDARNSGSPQPGPGHHFTVRSAVGRASVDRALSPPQRRTSSIPEEVDATATVPVEKEPCCMFIDNCNTGSQLRKAISHLFGRNKNCTQRIPKHVWVYYCRKHYQRIRYRNAQSYPQTQMDLVKVQILRLQAWSEKNRKEGKGSYIEGWEFSLRKREQKRLVGDQGAADDHSDDDQGGQGSSAPPWIIQRLGKGYKTEEVLAIAEQLHDELVKGMYNLVPEVEFLPNIIDEGTDNAAKPGRGRRQSSVAGGTKTPKRKASDADGDTRRMSVGPQYMSHHDELPYGVVSPSEKRARMEEVATLQHAGPSSSPYTRMPASSAMTASGGPAFPYGHGQEMALPRAPTVVPKLRSSIFTAHAGGSYAASQSSYGYYDDRGGEGSQDPVLLNDTGSSSSQSYARPVAGYGGQLTLPSISAQISGYQGNTVASGSRRQPYNNNAVGMSSGHGVYRPTHQRSASAYTPVSRPTLASSRPSSSGYDSHGGVSQPNSLNPLMPAPDLDLYRPLPGGQSSRQHNYSNSWSQNYHHGAAPPANSHYIQGLVPRDAAASSRAAHSAADARAAAPSLAPGAESQAHTNDWSGNQPPYGQYN